MPGCPPALGGGFVIVWQSWPQDGSGYGIIGRRFSCPDIDGDGNGDPASPSLYVRIFGLDSDLPPTDPFRRTFGDVARFDVAP